MTNKRSDQIIRERIEMLNKSDAPVTFDEQRYWEKMENRLTGPSIIKYRWWKYAAALLLLITGAYFLLIQPLPSDNNVKIKLATKDVVMHDPTRDIETTDHTKGKGQSTKKKITAINKRKISKKKIRKTLVTNVKQEATRADSINIIERKTTDYVKVTVHDSINISSKIPHRTFVRAKPEGTTSLPVVYYKEITTPSAEAGKHVKPASNLYFKLSNKKHIQKELVANQTYFGGRLKIHISSKN